MKFVITTKHASGATLYYKSTRGAEPPTCGWIIDWTFSRSLAFKWNERELVNQHAEWVENTFMSLKGEIDIIPFNGTKEDTYTDYDRAMKGVDKGNEV